MRLSEEIIIQAILHRQRKIRQRAVRYFDDCYIKDEGIVPLVIQAVEKYGRVPTIFYHGSRARGQHRAGMHPFRYRDSTVKDVG